MRTSDSLKRGERVALVNGKRGTLEGNVQEDYFVALETPAPEGRPSWEHGKGETIIVALSDIRFVHDPLLYSKDAVNGWQPVK